MLRHMISLRNHLMTVSHTSKCCRLAWPQGFCLSGAHCVRQYLKYVRAFTIKWGVERPFNLNHEANAPHDSHR